MTSRFASPDMPVRGGGGWIALLCGLFLAFSLIKLGNPVVLDGRTPAPRDFSQALAQTWPAGWGVIPGMVLVGLGLLLGRKGKFSAPMWLFWAPLGWLVWQGISAVRTVHGTLTIRTLAHFAVLVGLFYVGSRLIAAGQGIKKFWWALVVGVTVVLGVGFQQHYLNLDDMAAYMEQHEKTGWRDLPAQELNELVQSHVLVPQSDGSYAVHPEVQKRIGKRRIFSTLVYPNALAGVVILFLPPLAVFLWRESSGRLSVKAGMVVVGIFVYAGLACLVWSGSKAGWLIVLVQTGLLLLHLPFPKRMKQLAVGAVLVVGLGAFAFKFSNYFKAGATSVGARVECWQAALKVTGAHPLLGTGPGTFGVPYQQMKRPEAEMSHLVHNDYLEQASDSGVLGLVLFLAWMPGVLIWVYRERFGRLDAVGKGLALGLAGWALQSAVEFGFYIPALGWSGALFLGLLLGLSAGENVSTNPASAAKVSPAK